MGPQHGNVVNFSGIYIGGAYATAYVGGATGRHGAIKSLGTPEAKLHDRVALGGIADAGRLGGYQGLEVDDVEQIGRASCRERGWRWGGAVAFKKEATKTR